MYLILLIAGAVLLIAAGSKTVGPAAPPLSKGMAGAIAASSNLGVVPLWQAVTGPDPATAAYKPVGIAESVTAMKTLKAGSKINIQGPATLAVKPGAGGYPVTDESSASLAFTADYNDETANYGGIDIICETGGFWRTVSRFRPRRRLVDLQYPSVINIEHRLEIGGWDPIYSIPKTYFSDGASIDKHLIKGAYVDPMLTHPHNSAMDLWYMRLYHNNSTPPYSNMDPTDFVRDYCKGMRLQPYYSPMVNLCNILSKEIFLENMQEWVLFCKGTDASDYGDVDHDSLHSYYVANYVPVAERISYWDALGRAYKDISGVGKLIVSVIQLVISAVSPFVGKLLSETTNTAVKTLRSIIEKLSGMFEEIQVFFRDIYGIGVRYFMDLWGSIENYCSTYIAQVKKLYDDYFALPLSKIYPVEDMPFIDDAKSWFESKKGALKEHCTMKHNNMKATLIQSLDLDASEALPSLSNLTSYEVEEMNAYGMFARNVKEIIIYIPKGV